MPLTLPLTDIIIRKTRRMIPEEARGQRALLGSDMNVRICHSVSDHYNIWVDLALEEAARRPFSVS